MIKLAIRLFNQNEISHLELILSQVKRRTKTELVLTSINNADAIVVTPGDPGFDALLRKTKNETASSAVSIVYDTTNASRHPYFLKKPATTDGVIGLIDDIEKHQETATTEKTEEGRQEKPGSPVSYSPCISSIKEAVEKQQNIEISINSERSIYIHAELGIAYAMPADIHDLSISNDLKRLISSPRKLPTQTIDGLKVASIASNDSYSQINLDVLLWTITLNSPELFSLDESSVITLNSWPDFTALPYESSYLSLTAHLMMHPGTIGQIAKKSTLDEGLVKAFVLACASNGLLKVLEPQASPANLEPSRNRASPKRMISKVMGHFFGNRKL